MFRYHYFNIELNLLPLVCINRHASIADSPVWSMNFCVVFLNNQMNARRAREQRNKTPTGIVLTIAQMQHENFSDYALAVANRCIYDIRIFFD